MYPWKKDLSFPIHEQFITTDLSSTYDILYNLLFLIFMKQICLIHLLKFNNLDFLESRWSLASIWT
jgi:hypothetical protein